MTTPTVRLHEAQASDYDALTAVWREVYGEGVIGEAQGREDKSQTLYIGYVGDAPAFGAIVNEYDVHVRGRYLKTAGVGAVATVGVHRGSGVGTECMCRMHDDCIGRGYQLAALYGFREAFYRRLGYEGCSWRWEIRCTADRLPKLKSDLPAYTVSVSEVEKLNPCYQAFMETFNGSSRRGSELWQNRMGQKPPTIYAFGDPVEAYIWCNPEGFYNDLSVGEFAWSTPRGYRNALAMIRSLTINKNAAVWYEPPDSPFLAQYTDYGAEAKRARPAMFTVLNADSTLEGLNVKGRFGRMVVRGQGGETVVEGGGKGEVRLTVQTLTQLVMGDPGPEALVRFGLLEGDDEAVSGLVDALPRQQSLCMEFF